MRGRTPVDDTEARIGKGQLRINKRVAVKGPTLQLNLIRIKDRRTPLRQRRKSDLTRVRQIGRTFQHRMGGNNVTLLVAATDTDCRLYRRIAVAISGSYDAVRVQFDFKIHRRTRKLTPKLRSPPAINNLRCAGLLHIYARVTALRGVDFEIRPESRNHLIATEEFR